MGGGGAARRSYDARASRAPAVGGRPRRREGGGERVRVAGSCWRRGPAAVVSSLDAETARGGGRADPDSVCVAFFHSRTHGPRGRYACSSGCVGIDH